MNLKYIQKRLNDIYYFRRAVPSKFWVQFGSKKEIIISLRTKDKDEALVRYAVEKAKSDAVTRKR